MTTAKLGMTTAEALKIIRDDGQVAGRNTNGKWFVYFDVAPGYRRLMTGLDEVGLCGLANYILDQRKARLNLSAEPVAVSATAVGAG